MNKKDIAENIDELCRVAYQQAQEDREAIVAAYEDLKNQLTGQLHAYAASGDTLAKFADIRIKQNNQFIELLKVLKKDVPSDDSLTDEDYEKIADAIEKIDD